MEKNYFSPSNDLSFITDFFRKNAKIYLFTGIVSVILATLLFFVQKEKFQSQGTIFPTESNAIENSVNNPQVGYDVEADRLLQLLQSKTMQDSIVRRFDLLNYFKIDTTQKDWKYQTDQKYKRMVFCFRTKFMSINILTKSQDPQMSADICNAVMEVANRMREHVYKSNMRLATEALKSEYLVKKTELDSLVQRINRLKNEKNAGNHVLTGNQFFTFDNSRHENLTELEILINQYNFQQSRANDAFNRYDNARQNLARPISQIYTIDKAYPDAKKVSPHLLYNLLQCASFLLLLVTSFLILRGKTKKQAHA